MNVRGGSCGIRVGGDETCCGVTAQTISTRHEDVGEPSGVYKVIDELYVSLFTFILGRGTVLLQKGDV